MSDLEYWLALNFLADVGPVITKRLLSVFGSPGKIFQMSFGELKKVNGVGESRARSIAGFNQWEKVRREIERAEKSNIRLIPFDDSAYPEGLRHIYDAPMVLYARGDFTETDKYAVAMVGSRRASDYGMQTAEKISHELAASGLTVVSGMAMGIDTASHKGALEAGGRTVAVLGSGIDIPYPAANRNLVKTIESSGTVISEFPMGTPPNRENFPKRNRIISGLSLGVIVVEATIDSGSLITVGYALEQGKEVFAVPGNITSKNSKGTNDLIKKGARLVESADEVIDELGSQIKGILKEEKPDNEKKMYSMNQDEKAICNSLSLEPKHIDFIIREMKMSTGRALSILLNLELKGIIRQAEGKLFSLAEKV